MMVIDPLMNQLGKPSGFFGKLIGLSMNFGHQKVYKMALGSINLDKKSRILDIGCGGGKFIQLLSKYHPQAKINGIDYSETMVKSASKLNQELIEQGKVIIEQGSVSLLPFSNNYFDLVTGIETYYFWPNLINDLKEIYRVLKQGASLLLVNELHIHENSNPIIKKLSDKVNIDIHTPTQFYNFFKEAGFINIEISTRGNLISIIGNKPSVDPE